MNNKEKRYLILVTIVGLLAICLSILDLAIDFYIPGLSPIVNALLWFLLWRLFAIRKQLPGVIWTFAYILIIGLNLVAGVSQIINVIT